MTVTKKSIFDLKKLITDNAAWFVQNTDAIKGGVASVLTLIAASQPDSLIMQLLFGASTGVVTYLAGSWIEYLIKKYTAQK